MQLIPIEVHGSDGAQCQAQLIICAECQGQSFVIFLLAGHDTPHLQCLGCHTSYCGNSEGCDLEGDYELSL